ncbi:MAG: hypothetical protein H0T76_24450 [Nannocystis sp.]|nr:hypothetical protein [Nannocystis sp.]MBA3549641.1 hypothetical protein [Nannocystis sp.]
MDYDKLAALALAFPILAAATTPGVAQACPGGYYDPCEGVNFWQDITAVNAAKIPSDGVLVLQGTHQGDDAASLPSIEVTVTTDGQPLAGALEVTSLHGVLVWRPSEPWVPGATYAMSATITNPPEADSPYSEYCAPLMIVSEDTLNIDVAPGAALGPADFSGETQISLSPQISLETLACCEGATPSYGYSGCGGGGVYWDPEECAPTQAHGYLSVAITGQPAATGAAAGQIVYALEVEGMLHSTSLSPQFTVFTDTPFCAVIEATDLAGGAVTQSQKHCFGEAVAGQLGAQVLDPSEKLTCALENCAANGEVWDPMNCTPVDPGAPTGSDSDDSASSSSGSSASNTAGESDGDAGCGCDTRPTGDAGLLALVGVVGLLRRSKRTRRRRGRS